MEFFRNAKNQIQAAIASESTKRAEAANTANQTELQRKKAETEYEQRRKESERKFHSIRPQITQVLKDANQYILDGKGSLADWQQITYEYNGYISYGESGNRNNDTYDDGLRNHHFTKKIDAVRLFVSGRGEVLVFVDCDTVIEGVSVAALKGEVNFRNCGYIDPLYAAKYIHFEQNQETSIQNIAETVASSLVDLFK